MKKNRLILLFLLRIYVCPFKAYATDYIDEIENITEQYNKYGDEISDLTLEKIWNIIKNEFTLSFRTPLKQAASVAGVILICALIKSLQINNNNEINTVTDTICIMFIFITLLAPLQDIQSLIESNLLQVKEFMVMFLPVFSSISLAGGEIVSSTIYSGILLTGMVFLAELCTSIILPSTNLFFAVTVADAMSPYIRLNSLSDFYLKAVRLTLKGIASLICFILTIQGVISHSGDTLAVKAGKVLAGTAIPVVGSVLQEAVSSVYAGMEAIKGFAGAAGIFTVISIFLPVLITLLIYWIYLNVLHIIADLFDTVNVKKCIKGFTDITELMVSVSVIIMILFVFSLTLMIALTNGV